MNNKIRYYYDSYFHTLEDNSLNRMKRKARFKVLKRFLNNQNGDVLVIGCGSQGEMGILSNTCKGVGIDISKTAISKTKKAFPQYKYLVSDATNLPFKNSRFNCVVCSEVMEHIPNREKLYKEIKRVLKKRGLLILTTPNWLSWYGLARKIAEICFKKPFTADNQPVDNWQNSFGLIKRLKKQYKIIDLQGIWYFPPTGKGEIRIPDLLVLPIFWILYPTELILRKALPFFGHIFAIKAQLK